MLTSPGLMKRLSLSSVTTERNELYLLTENDQVIEGSLHDAYSRFRNQYDHLVGSTLQNRCSTGSYNTNYLFVVLHTFL